MTTDPKRELLPVVQFSVLRPGSDSQPFEEKRAKMGYPAFL
jgi:hypothetical protein